MHLDSYKCSNCTWKSERRFQVDPKHDFEEHFVLSHKEIIYEIIKPYGQLNTADILLSNNIKLPQWCEISNITTQTCYVCIVQGCFKEIKTNSFLCIYDHYVSRHPCNYFNVNEFQALFELSTGIKGPYPITEKTKVEMHKRLRGRGHYIGHHIKTRKEYIEALVSRSRWFTSECKKDTSEILSEPQKSKYDGNMSPSRIEFELFQKHLFGETPDPDSDGF